MNHSAKSDDIIVSIPPFNYIHVLDRNTNVTRLVTGPLTFYRQDHESIVKTPQKMMTITARQYCIIRNPVKRDTEEQIILEHGQVALDYGEEEYRFAQPPFPLYPGEMLHEDIKELLILPPNEALLLRAIVAFTTTDGLERIPGEQWLFEGPGVYKPCKEVSVVSQRSAEMIVPNTALLMEAVMNFTDRTGKKRVCGEKWLVREPGSYMIGAYEKKVSIYRAYNLDEKHALHVRASMSHVDSFGRKRRHGEEWLITHLDTESHIPSVYEEDARIIQPLDLTSRHYCVICDPVGENGLPCIGKKKLVRGDKAFFLWPGERLLDVIQHVSVLSEDEGLIIRAMESFMDGDKQRVAGEEWMLVGPLEYIPPIEAHIVEDRRAIPLGDNEGIYVRDRITGKVRSVIGSTYMLTQTEELWKKTLPPAVEELLRSTKDPLADRSIVGSRGKAVKGGDSEQKAFDTTRVVSYRVPHNAVAQIYDYKRKRARFAFGPELVMLDPDEEFTVLSLSGGRPKRPNMIRSICLLLGPDFCTDVLIVETADHARLSIQLSYNWHFEISKDKTAEEAAKLFDLPDFIGDFCKAIAARVRGAVASVNFDAFHKNSAQIIRESVFGRDIEGNRNERFTFQQNNLVVTSVDIQSVEPVDQRTRDALMKSVQLAIEITSNSQEAAARHEAERLEQEARGRLERQKIEDEASAELARRHLLELQVLSATLESTGQAKAEAESKAVAMRIASQTEVEKARLEVEAETIRTAAEVKRLEVARAMEMEYMKKKNDLCLERRRQELDWETEFYLKCVEAIGPENLRQIACSGAERDVRMLKALNLKSALITDGKTPISLLDATAGLISKTASVVCSAPTHEAIEEIGSTQ